MSYGNVGCCLTCGYSYEGCLCNDCSCTSCEEYENRSCGRVMSVDRWKDIKKVFEKEERFEKKCPVCEKIKFMKHFDSDDFTDWDCFGCHNYFTDDFLGGK